MHEKMPNVPNYYRNANRNCNEILAHTSWNGHHEKNQQTINPGEDVEEKEPSYTTGESLNWYSHY